MRIAYLLPAHDSASADDQLRLARTFASLGHEVVVLTAGGSLAADDLDVRSIPLDPFDEHALKLLREDGTAGDAVRMLLEGATLRERAGTALADFRPDFVYERWAPFTAAGSHLAAGLGVRAIVERSENGTEIPPSTTVDTLERAALEAADFVVTSSETERARLAASGLDGGRLTMVPAAVEVDGYDLTTPVRDALRSLLRVADRQTVGVIADLEADRDLTTVMRAVEELGRRGLPVTLLAVGEGPERSALEHRAESSVDVTAIVPGAVPEEQIPAYLAAIDVAVAPSTQGAAFPARRLLQYLAAAVPVVAAEGDGVTHCIRNGETGLLYQPGDAAGLCDSLESLLRDRDRANALALAGREHVTKRHSWNERARSVLALIDGGVTEMRQQSFETHAYVSS